MILIDLSIKEINEISKNNGAVFYGAGMILRRLLDILSDSEVLKYTKYIVDGSSSLQGTVFEYTGISIPIISPEEYYNKHENELLIISSSYAWDIYNSLNRLSSLSNTKCCCYHVLFARFVREREEFREYPNQIRLLEKPVIPPKIHYCWFGGGEIPEEYNRYIESWYKYCPKYEIVRWDESNYDINSNVYVKEAYEMKKWAFVSDVARLEIIYREGGIYLDTDVEVLRSLDDLRYQYCFFGVENLVEYCTVSSGLGFGAVAGSKEIGSLINLYANTRFMGEDNEMDLTACPIRQTPYFANRGWNGKGDYYHDDELTIYPMYVLSGSDMNTGYVFRNEYTYTIHHYGMSWLSENTKRKIQGLRMLARLVRQNG